MVYKILNQYGGQNNLSKYYAPLYMYHGFAMVKHNIQSERGSIAFALRGNLCC